MQPRHGRSPGSDLAGCAHPAWLGTVGMEAEIFITECELARSAGDLLRAEAAVRAVVSLSARTEMDGFLGRGLELLGALGATVAVPNPAAVSAAT